ncbi:FAD-binding oxidoreductase [Comamonadaceae bacterium G21597-S1]|nr:FAD-binding oxidoreductase [Comamonadaceae bacterium G21597-S1]
MGLWRTAILDSDTQLNQRSYYEASCSRSDEPPLQESIDADVLVVGAGFTGLSAAIELARGGLQVVVLEADRICSGASGRNGGQAIVGFASGQQAFEQQLGPADARRAWDMSLEALDLIDSRIAEFGIDCDRRLGYLYVADSPRKARALEQEMQRTERDYGLSCEMVHGDAVRSFIGSDRYCAAAYEGRSGHLHPLKYGLGLARAARQLGVRIFERSAVRSLERGAHLRAICDRGQVRARFVVLAGNCALAEYGPGVAAEIRPRIMPVGTYMVATAPLTQARCAQLIARDAAVCDNNFALDYFRCSADHRLLFGGRVSYTTMTPRDLETAMRQRVERAFPELASVPIEFVWGGFVDISMNRMPDFGRLDDNLYYLQGFSGHGVALTGLAGRLVAEAVAGQAQRFDLFARLRHRAFPGGPWLRTPSLALAMWYQQLRDLI